MCGLVGIASCVNDEGDALDLDIVREFSNMLIAGQARGVDSTGIFAVDTNHRVSTWKAAVDAHTAVQSKGYLETVGNSSNKTILAGHNRDATLGTVTEANAHPFVHDEITLMHNGTITDRSGLHGGDTYEVDSEAIAYSISMVGLAHTLPSLVGSFALVWWDSNLETINFIRDGTIPLYVACSLSNRKIIWSSDGGMLNTVSNSTKLSCNANTVSNMRAFETTKSFTPYIHYALSFKGYKIEANCTTYTNNKRV